MESTLLAGVARVNITPSTGVDIMGTARRWQHAQGIHQDLTATCLVLATDECRFVFLACDLLGIPDPTSRELRTRIGAIVGAPAAHVLIGCSHTHNGPATSPHKPKIGGDQTALSQEELTYIANLGYQLESVARIAASRLQPARLATGKGTASLNINRRETLPNGQVVIGRNPQGPCDEEVSVLRVDSANQEPLAAVVTYTSHPVITPLSHLISPDFVGTTREVVEQLTGAMTLYFTGAAGNINCRNYLETDLRVAERVGRQLGCEAARVFLGLKTLPTETRPEYIKSVSSLKIYPEVPIDRPAISHFGIKTKVLELPLQALPTLAEAEQILQEKEQILRDLEARDSDRSVINPAIYQLLWAQKLVTGIRNGTALRSVSAEVQVIRLDDTAFIAVPGEAFVEMALTLKQRSPAQQTIFIGYANGAIGYIPMREDYARGGYEVEQAFKGYGYPTVLAPGAAETIVETCLDLLSELWCEQAKERL